MPDVDGLQLYLLSRMSADDLVNGALGHLGVTRTGMRRRAREVAARHGLDAPGHPAEAYTRLLGSPADEGKLGERETGRAFVGSVRRRYALPLWPTVLLSVNRHPAGYAWGVGFEQPEPLDWGDDPLSHARAARPWQLASDALFDAAAAVERLEEWTHDLEALLTFLGAEGREATWRARFDFGLLQDWARWRSPRQAASASPSNSAV